MRELESSEDREPEEILRHFETYMTITCLNCETAWLTADGQFRRVKVV